MGTHMAEIYSKRFNVWRPPAGLLRSSLLNALPTVKIAIDQSAYKLSLLISSVIVLWRRTHGTKLALELTLNSSLTYKTVDGTRERERGHPNRYGCSYNVADQKLNITEFP